MKTNKVISGTFTEKTCKCADFSFYDWRENVGEIIRFVRSEIVKRKKETASPIEMTLSAFSKSLESEYAQEFFDYVLEIENVEGTITEKYLRDLDRYRVLACSLEESAFHEYERVKDFISNKLIVRNFLTQSPTEVGCKYPLCIQVQKLEDGTCIMRQVGSVKYPTFSEIVMDKLLLPIGIDCSLYFLLVVGQESLGCKSDIKKALWGFKLCDSVLEFYEGRELFVQLLNVIEEPFKMGVLVVEGDNSL